MDDAEAGPTSAEELNERSRSGAIAALGQGAPPAKEPLDPDTLNTLGDIAFETATKLSGGEAEPPRPAPAEGPQEQIPGDLFALLVVFEGFAQKVAPEMGMNLATMATTNQGLQELTGMIGELGGEAAMSKPPPPKPEAKPEAEPPKKDLSAKRFMKEPTP